MELDTLGLGQDAVLQAILDDDELETETVVLSCECAMLSYNYRLFKLSQEISLTLVLTTKAIYLFPPRIDVDNRSNKALTYNSFDKFILEDIYALSLPYNTESSSTSDVAVRTNDVAIHMYNSKSLWVRLQDLGNGENPRSQFVQLLSDLCTDRSKRPIEVNQDEYRDVIAFVGGPKIESWIFDLRYQYLATIPCIKQGPVKFSCAPYSKRKTLHKNALWVTKWAYLTLHDIWLFNNENEVQSYMYALAMPAHKRASLPKLGRVGLDDTAQAEMVDFRNGAKGFTLTLPSADWNTSQARQKPKSCHFAPIVSSSNIEKQMIESLNWVEAILNRYKEFQLMYYESESERSSTEHSS